MDAFQRRLRRALKKGFPDCDLLLEMGYDGDRIGGLMMWDGFQGKDELDRQKKLHRFLDKNLSPRDRVRVATIITMTPDENAALRELD